MKVIKWLDQSFEEVFLVIFLVLMLVVDQLAERASRLISSRRGRSDLPSAEGRQ